MQWIVQILTLIKLNSSGLLFALKFSLVKNFICHTWIFTQTGCATRKISIFLCVVVLANT